MTDIEKELRDSPTVSVPRAAQLLGISRNGAYEAVKRGAIPSIGFGKLGGTRRIPSAWLRRVLQIDELVVPETKPVIPEIVTKQRQRKIKARGFL